MGSIGDLSLAGWRDAIDTNLTSAFLGAKHQVPAMIERGGGSLIFTSTFVGHTVGFGGLAAYAASKAGLIGLMQVLAVEVGAKGIRVNVILPGGTDTPSNAANAPGAAPETRAFIEGLHALKRLAKPDEIAQSALYLASDASWRPASAASLEVTVVTVHPLVSLRHEEAPAGGYGCGAGHGSRSCDSRVRAPQAIGSYHVRAGRRVSIAIDVRGKLIALVLDFVRAARRLAGVERIALVGSLATGKARPKDVDVLVTIAPEVDFEQLARIGRRLKGRAQGINSAADIFLADRAGKYLRRLCSYRECHPRVLCHARHCGRQPHLNDDLDVVALAAALIAAPPAVLHPAVIRGVPVPDDVEHVLLGSLEGDSISIAPSPPRLPHQPDRRTRAIPMKVQPDHSDVPVNRSMPSCAVIPVLAYEDVREAVEWLCKTFGFVERLRIGSHRAQLSFGAGAVVVTEQRADQALGTPGGAERRPPGRDKISHSIMVRVEDANRHYEHATRCGARILHPPTDHPYGERQYTAEDPGGHRWTFSQTIADVDPKEWGGTLASGPEEQLPG